jgi:hypothetical protein
MLLKCLQLVHRAVFVTSFVSIVTGVQVFNSPNDLPNTIPEECRTALSANISCSALIKANELISTKVVNETFLEEYCDCECTDSLGVSIRQVMECSLEYSP